MELIFAYGAGLLTLINPCVLPVLPIVLGSALSADRRGPLALAAGMSLSFVVFGMRSAAVPLFVTEGMDRGASLTGIGFLVAAGIQAVLLLPAGRMASWASWAFLTLFL